MAMKPNHGFKNLQPHLGGSDSVRAHDLRRRLELTVAALVRRALLFPAERSPLQADVRAEVRRLGLTTGAELLAENRTAVRFIAGRICHRLMDRSREAAPRWPARETVRC